MYTMFHCTEEEFKAGVKIGLFAAFLGVVCIPLILGILMHAKYNYDMTHVSEPAAYVEVVDE